MCGESVTDMANILVGTIVRYLKTETHSTLEIVDIVIYEQFMLTEYAAAMRRATATSRFHNLKDRLSKTKTKAENVYQVSNDSHKLVINTKI